MTVRRALDVVTVAVVFATIAYIATAIPTLPQTIPTHFGPSGRADAYGSRYMLWLAAAILPGIAVIWSVSRIPLEQMNTGVRLTDENRSRVSAAMQQMLGSVALFLAVLGFWIAWTIAASARAGVWTGSITEIAVVVAIPFALIAIYYVQVFTGSSERG